MLFFFFSQNCANSSERNQYFSLFLTNTITKQTYFHLLVMCFTNQILYIAARIMKIRLRLHIMMLAYDVDEYVRMFACFADVFVCLFMHTALSISARKSSSKAKISLRSAFLRYLLWDVAVM